MRLFLNAVCVTASLIAGMLVSNPAAAMGALPRTEVRSGQLSFNFSDDAGGKRGYYVSLPPGYDTRRTYRLVVVFAGTHTTGKEMHEWFGQGWALPDKPGLEAHMEDTIFVYPDQKYSWDGDRGWALGPKAGDYAGNHDIQFTRELLGLLYRTYPVDRSRVFATGHSWGGDMSAVVGCFLGDQFRAIAPVAANRPYWFGTPPSTAGCVGSPAAWTVFGLTDDHFGDQSPNGQFGKEQNAFWTKKASCSSQFQMNGETKTYMGCRSEVRFTLYKGGQYSGACELCDHQPPDYFLEDVSSWFSSFDPSYKLAGQPNDAAASVK